MVPGVNGLALLSMAVSDASGNVLQRNFMHLEIKSEKEIPETKVLSVAPAAFSKAEWSKKQWNVREGRKVNGAGKGFFEYTFDIPDGQGLSRAKSSYLLMELFCQGIIC